MKQRRAVGLLALVLGVSISWQAQAYEACGELRNAFGPYDYWTDRDKLGIVETAHFTPEVETLRSGKSSYIGGDIDYTLRAFPNHPRALMSMLQLGEKMRTERPPGTHYTVNCYFDRAIRFRPEDPTARMLYAYYLVKKNKNTEALGHLEVSRKNAGDDPNLHYNLGLLFFDLGKYDLSLEHAHRAYGRGFNLPGLKGKLEKAGHWREPAVVPPAVQAEKPAANSTGGKAEAR